MFPMNQTAMNEPGDPAQPPPGTPEPLKQIIAARAGADAAREVRENGGLPRAIDALAMPRSETVHGVTLWANPIATDCARRLMIPFYPKPENPGEIPMDFMAGFVFCFAEPVRAYQLARRGADAFIPASLEWVGEHFTGADAEYKFGQVAGWCVGVAQMLDALNPRKPGAATNTARPAAPPPAREKEQDSPKAATPDSSPR